MSQVVYPVLESLSSDIAKVSNWGTRSQRAISGRTLRTSDMINPIWHFTLKYEALRDGSDTRFGDGWGTGFDELRTIMDFFNARAGGFDSFLFDDVTDDTAAFQAMVAEPTDTTGTLYHLARALEPGGFSEWITAPNIVSTVYDGAVPLAPSAYSVDATTGIVTFLSPPGGLPSADFTFYFRCVFPDSLDFEYFAYQLWELKQVKLTSLVAGL